MADKSRAIVCREIADADLGGIADLLAAGFPAHARAFWVDALAHLARRPSPVGYAELGHLLHDGTHPVGALLTIHTAMPADGAVRASVSSWYVRPHVRALAPLLASRALARKDVTYLNVTPAPGTWGLAEAHGYTCFARGRYITMAMLGGAGREPARVIDARVAATSALTHAEATLLADHAALGCRTLIVETGGEVHPFVFQLRHQRLRPPHALLIWCRSAADFVRCAGPLARHLARSGVLRLVIGADGPLDGLRGRFVEAACFFKGPARPRPEDLAYTEIPVLRL